MKSYPSDLREQEWVVIEPLMPPPNHFGRPRGYDFRDILNALFYVSRTGCQWRYLPHDFPPWDTVYYYFRKWRCDGTLEQIHAHLRREVRIKAGRESEPSAVIIDSQSVKTVQKGDSKGYDGNKKIKGRKRHLVVDTMGLMWACMVHSAGLQDGSAAKDFVMQTPVFSKRLEVVWGDLGYNSTPLAQLIKIHWGSRLEIKKHPWQGPQWVWVPPGQEPPSLPEKPKGFVVLAKRWIIERTFGWLNWFRRLSKDYEHKSFHSETFLYMSMLRIMLRRLAC